MVDRDVLNSWINSSKESMIGLQKILTAVPALAPENGGDGEQKKAVVLIDWCRNHGLEDIEVIFTPDERVSAGKRPNVILTIPGKDRGKALWIMTHLDIVPPGDLEKWNTEPYKAVEKNGKLYGRGVEDNQQGMVSSIFAVLALVKNGVTPPRDVKLLFVADEEVGSEFGIQYLINEHDIFMKGDMVLVPDGGNEEGTMMEIAEKSVLWLEFTLLGVQTHASRPEQGVNAFLAGSELVLELAALEDVYPERNELFEPPVSTFSPTKKDANVPNVNTIPGKDVFCLDSRILPSISVDEVMEEIESRCRKIEQKHGVTISHRVLQRVESKPTPETAEIVDRLRRAVGDIYDVQAAPVGIGGGTVAAYLRNAGYDTVVWAKMDETAHNPNEYTIIENMTGDARVMLHVMLGE